MDRSLLRPVSVAAFVALLIGVAIGYAVADWRLTEHVARAGPSAEPRGRESRETESTRATDDGARGGPDHDNVAEGAEDRGHVGRSGTERTSGTAGPGPTQGVPAACASLARDVQTV